MPSLVEIQALVEQIKNDLPLLINRTQIAPKQVVLVNGLSDMSERLGLVQAGEFRAGNGKEPGFGFYGVRMGYPAFSYAGDTWHLAGINNDVLQFGLSAATGKAYFAAGGAVLDTTGATFEAQNNQAYFLLWKTDDDQTTVGKIGAFYVSTDSGIEVVGQTKSGYTPVAHLMTADANSTFLTGVEVRGDGEIQIDLRTATSDAVGSQKVRVMSNTADTDEINPLLNLELNSKNTAAAGFGISLPAWIENASGTLKQIGQIAWEYIDPTNGGEDSKTSVSNIIAGTLVKSEVSTLLVGNGNSQTVPAASTRYVGVSLTGLQTTAGNTSVKAGVAKNLYVRTVTAQPAGGSLVVTLQVGNVGTALTVTIAAGSAAGPFSDTTNLVVLTAGAAIRWEVVNNDGAAASAQIGSISMEIA